MPAADPAPGVAAGIRNARRLAVVGIGDELFPADRLGLVSAREIELLQIPGVRVFCAGTVPESITGPLRKCRPDHVLLLDAAEMGLRPGSIAPIGPGEIPAQFVSTHVLPLSVVMEYIRRDTGAPVTLLGIQPDPSDPEKELSAEDREFFARNIRELAETIRRRLG